MVICSMVGRMVDRREQSPARPRRCAGVSIPTAPCATAGSISSGASAAERRLEPEPHEPGHGEERRLHLAGLELAQPGLDVAAQRHDPQVRAAPPASWAARRSEAVPTTAPGGSSAMLRAPRRDQRVARIGARQHGGDDQARRAGPSACPSSSGRRGRAGRRAAPSSISLVNRPLPPISASGRSWMRSPVRADDPDLDRVLGRPAPGPRPPAPRAPSAPGPAPAASRACRCGAAGARHGRFYGRSRQPSGPTLAMASRDGDIVLGIETSCDETAAALVARRRRGRSRHPVLASSPSTRPMAASCRRSQPAPTSRSSTCWSAQAHARGRRRLRRPRGSRRDRRARPDRRPDGRACVTAKAIACVHGLPLRRGQPPRGPCAHRPARRDGVAFPYLLLLVSGGHCQLVASRASAATASSAPPIDDALGEAFDKVAKMLGLGYPGGPAVEALAASGDPAASAPAPAAGERGLRLLLLRPQDRRPPPDPGRSAAAAGAPPPWPTCAPASRPPRPTSSPTARARHRRLRRRAAGPHRPGRRRRGRRQPRYLRAAWTSLATGQGCSSWRRRCICAATTPSWWPGPAIERLRLGPGDDQAVAARARWPLQELAAPLA